MSNLLEVTKQYLNVVSEQPSLYSMTPTEVRQYRAKLPKTKLDEVVELKEVEERHIPVRDGSNVKVRIYTPAGDGPFPIILYFHGGGWVLNSIETCDGSCRLLAAKSNSIVISVDYRLAPEFKFPIPVYDAYDSFLWTVEHAETLNGIRNEITVAGDSAGANLATVVTLMNKDLEGPEIVSQLLLYPVTDLAYDTPSYEEFQTGYGLDKKDMEWFGEYYLNSESEKSNPYAAPLQAKDLSGLPPALVIVAEHDVLRDEGIVYANKLEFFGVHVQLKTAKGLVHSFFTKNELFNQYINQTIDVYKSFYESVKK